MSTPQLKVGVIGLGVGEAHLRGYQDIEGCEIRSICDFDLDRLNEIGDRYGVDRRFEDYRRVTEDPEIDVVSICSYDDAHAEQVISAFRHDKHVMVEKPIALHRSEAEDIFRAFEDSGKLLTSNFVLRESPRFIELKARIDSGEFGKVYYMEGDYLHQILSKITEGWRGRMAFYCTLYGGGIHLIDLMRWLSGVEIVEVQAMGTDILVQNTTYTYDDTIVALMKCSDGTLLKSATTFGPMRPKFHSLNVYGTNRTYVNELASGQIYTGLSGDDVQAISGGYQGGDNKTVLLPDFISAIREGRKPLVSEVDVFRVMDICFTAWDALQKKCAVKVDYII